MQTIKPSQLRVLLRACIRAHCPLLISGAPGIGKTDNVEQVSADENADSIITHPVVSDPTDYKGLPWITDGEAHFMPFGDMNRLITAQRLTVCFADDVGMATPAVQGALMQLILARRVNGHVISPHVVFVVATNRRQDRANVSGLLEPLKSRFVTSVELAADLRDWCVWAASADIAPEVIAFLNFRPELLSDFQPTADMTNSASPRGWASVSKLLSMGLPADILLPAVKGAVGEGPGTEFIAFLRIWTDMVSPDVVLAAPDAAPIPSEPSAMYALATALAVKVGIPTMSRYCRYLERLIAAGLSEFAAVSVQTALARDAKLANCPAYVKAATGPIGSLLLGQ